MATRTKRLTGSLFALSFPFGFLFYFIPPFSVHERPSREFLARSLDGERNELGLPIASAGSGSLSLRAEGGGGGFIS